MNPRIIIRKHHGAWWTLVPGNAPGNNIWIARRTFDEAIALAEFTIWDRPRLENQEPCS